MYLKYAKVRDVKDPTRANPGDAGLDFFVPDGPEPIRIEAGGRVNLPSGIKVEVPFGFALVFFNKSGVAAKKGLLTGACIVDHGYKGEVHLNLINPGVDAVYLSPGDKAIQALLLPVILPSLLQVFEEELYADVMLAGARGAGAFGSTDRPVEIKERGVGGALQEQLEPGKPICWDT